VTHNPETGEISMTNPTSTGLPTLPPASVAHIAANARWDATRAAKYADSVKGTDEFPAADAAARRADDDAVAAERAARFAADQAELAAIIIDAL
jgi:hypothetical protein